MSLSPHEQLVELLMPSLQHIEWNSCSSSGSFLAEHVITLGLHFLVGGSIMDIQHMIGTYICLIQGT
jgi:hypothetical protein